MIDDRSANVNIRNLTRLLVHLDRNVAKPNELEIDDTTQQKGRNGGLSPFERQKLRANFEHARALLLRLEHDSTSINVASRKRTVQADLRAKREQIKKLQLRIQELDDAEQSESDDEEVVTDDVLAGQQPIANDDHTSEREHDSTTHSSYGLKKISGSASAANAVAYSTGIHSANSGTRPENEEVANREKTLTTDRKEQEQIMDSLLSLTRQLKTSASVFQGSLENEKSLLDKASKGLDTNVDGMDAAGKRMGTLRKMTEGKGFFARLKLYGFVAALWLIALVMVFVLPKLRF